MQWRPTKNDSFKNLLKSTYKTKQLNMPKTHLKIQNIVITGYV